ncbi:MAG: type II toxin-antitoxin system RelE/ParE family toxin, partial [Bacteroidota bacterium]
MKKCIVIWNKSAESKLQREYQKIKQESVQGAEKVKNEILTETRRLSDNPERYPPDKYKRDNPGNYRAFEKHAYQTTYRHTEKEVRILRIRHVKQEPNKNILNGLELAALWLVVPLLLIQAVRYLS